MKKICSNQVLERTFSNHVFEIDVDSIEKLIYCSLQGGPFGGPTCPPVSDMGSKLRLLPADEGNGCRELKSTYGAHEGCTMKPDHS